MLRFLPCVGALFFTATAAFAQVVLNEIHYHPVERPAFDASGNAIYQGTATIADLSDDVHEFVELFNTGGSAVSLTGCRLAGGVDFSFASGASIPAGGYLVVAKNPARIQTVYGISGVLGPFTGKLGNGGDTVKLVNATGAELDAVSYGGNFPWAISANAFGVDADFLGVSLSAYQYKGRSLQRVSATASPNDPANWLAVRPAIGITTFADLPTPGAANIVTRSVPKPAVVERLVTQVSDGATIIRTGQGVKITATFSSTATLSNVQVEYFVENMNAFGETRNTVTMTAGANNQFTATLPAQTDRTIVRWRINANRGDGLELVLPRADDPAVVQVGAPSYSATPDAPNAMSRIPAPREAWLTYFVTPTRSSLKPVIDVLVSATGSSAQFDGLNGLQALAYNIQGSPKRTTDQTTTSSYPRETPYVLATDRIWNDIVPGVFAKDGVAYDINIRYHGSRYNRSPARKSFKVFFPEYQPYTDVNGFPVTSVFETDKGDSFSTAHGLFQLANLPLSPVRYVDWYFNSDGVVVRLEQGEYNGELLDNYHEKMQRLTPGSVKEDRGEFYKSVGYLASSNTGGEGPYGSGNGWRLPASGFWTELQRFEFTFGLQNHQWKGAKPIMDLVNSMWDARGDVHTAPAPNLVNTKAWFQANWDVESELTSLALGNWFAPYDDTTQNHYLWRRTNGKWARLLWDFDGMYGAVSAGGGATGSFYHGEVGATSNNSRGPNYFVDSFLKCFRPEFNQRMWELNNTLLDPENLQTLTYINNLGAAVDYFTYINSLGGGFAIARFDHVNSTLGLGAYYKPTRPTNTAPTNGTAVLPGASLTGSTYGYNAAYTHAAAPSVSPHTKSKWEIRTAAGTYDNPIYIATLTTNLTALPIPFGQLTFGQTYFWRVTYYDALGHPSITSAETSFSYGPSSVTAGNVSLNEVMADNKSAVINGGAYADYVELKNNTGSAVNITGWSLTDDELLPNKYVFPATTTIPANSHLIVWCDNNLTLPGLHAGFELSRNGQRVILIQSGTVKDAITFGPQLTNVPIGRVADGTGAWTLVNPSAGAVNTARSFSTSAVNIKFNEWMADPASGEDWFELFNPDVSTVSLANLWLSDTPATPKITQIPALTFIGTKNFTKFKADGSAGGFDSANFKLSSGGDSLILSTSDGLFTLASTSFGLQQRAVSQGRFPNGSASIVAFPQSASPEYSNWLPAPVVINEALTNSITPLEDIIELHNPTASTVDVSGWWISDDRTALQKFQIPAATTIPAGGFRTFSESQFNIGANAFSLSSLGEEIVITAVDGVGAETGYRAQVSFGAAADNVSFGRVATGGKAEFWPLVGRTFGSANAASLIGPVVVNEVHYHPPDLVGPTDNVRDEFVELHNITTSSVGLAGWRLKGDSDFTFAAGTVLRPGDYILVVGFNPATDTASLNAFRAALNVPVSVPIYGPFTPKLANNTASVEIAFPGTIVGTVTPFINADKVEYADFAPWPLSADGGGASLQRISRALIGNDVSNWQASTPTPGTMNSGQSAILDNDGDAMPNAWETLYGLDPFNAADAAGDLDNDTTNNVTEYLAGTAPNNAADRFIGNVTKNTGGGFRVNFTAKAGRSYTIQYKAALSDSTWSKLTDIAAPGSDTAVSHLDSTMLNSRFYRIITPQQP